MTGKHSRECKRLPSLTILYTYLLTDCMVHMSGTTSLLHIITRMDLLVISYFAVLSKVKGLPLFESSSQYHYCFLTAAKRLSEKLSAVF